MKCEICRCSYETHVHSSCLYNERLDNAEDIEKFNIIKKLSWEEHRRNIADSLIKEILQLKLVAPEFPYVILFESCLAKEKWRMGKKETSSDANVIYNHLDAIFKEVQKNTTKSK